MRAHPGSPGSAFLVKLSTPAGHDIFVRPCDVAMVRDVGAGDGTVHVQLYDREHVTRVIGDAERVVRALGLHEDGFRVNPGPVAP